MAVIAPQTDLYLIKSPLEIDEVNQLTFSNATAQYNYFSSLPKIGVDDFTYQRKDGTIRYGGNFDDLIGYNYCMYRNDAFSDKWFYAFITGMEYLNDSVTAITIKTDVYQTWMFQLNYKPVFVEREHVNDDSYGIHTVPENFELGEMVVNKKTEVLDSFNDVTHGGSLANKTVVVMGVTQAPVNDNSSASTVEISGDRIYSGIFQGLYFLVFDDMENPARVIHMYDEAGTSNAIYCIFQAPKSIFPLSTFATPHYWEYTKGSVHITAAVYYPDVFYGGYNNCTLANTGAHPNYRIIDPETDLLKYNVDNYEFHNNKMLTYPYSYIYITNNAGGDAIYRWEDFKVQEGEYNQTVAAYFGVYGSLSATCSTKIVPKDYKKLYSSTVGLKEPNYSYGLTGQKFVACSWNSDYYTNWITQNGVNIGLDAITSTASALLGVATATAAGNFGAAASSVISYADKIGGIISEKYKASITPNQAKGDINCGDVNYSVGKTGFTIQTMSVRYEIAQIIDRYWDMFGYQVNTVKVPNVTGRRNWNYVKTVGCYIDADIPQDDLDEIKNMFNNGVTFWHNPATFADYSQNNDII